MSHEELVNAIQKLDIRLNSLEFKIDDSFSSRSSPHADASAGTSANRTEHFVFSADNNDGALRQRNQCSFLYLGLDHQGCRVAL